MPKEVFLSACPAVKVAGHSGGHALSMVKRFISVIAAYAFKCRVGVLCLQIPRLCRQILFSVRYRYRYRYNRYEVLR